MGHNKPGIKTFFLGRFYRGLRCAELGTVSDEGGGLLLGGPNRGGKRMIGRNRDKRRAIKRVGPGGKDLNRINIANAAVYQA